MHTYRKYLLIVAVSLVCLFSYSLIEENLLVPSTETPLGTPESVHASLLVASTTYPIVLPHGGTAYDAMSMAASQEKSFTFKATLYPDLGYFIEEIQGKPNKQGIYWTLYINDVYATQGASRTTLKDGDRISWKYQSL